MVHKWGTAPSSDWSESKSRTECNPPKYNLAHYKLFDQECCFFTQLLSNEAIMYSKNVCVLLKPGASNEPSQREHS